MKRTAADVWSGSLTGGDETNLRGPARRALARERVRLEQWASVCAPISDAPNDLYGFS